MSDMTASVVLRFVDELSGPAKRAAGSMKGLVRDIEKMQKLVARKSSQTRQIEGMTRQFQKAADAARGLNRTLSRPVGNGFARASAGIEKVRREAIQASRAVEQLDLRLRRGGGENLGGGSGGHGGRRSPGHGSFGGGFGHFVGHAFAASGIYETVHAGIHGTIESVKAGFEQAFEMQHTKTMLLMQGESQDMINRAEATARGMTKSLPTFTAAQHMEAIAELRPALTGGLNEAVQLAPAFQQAVSVLEAVKQGSGANALKGVNPHGDALDFVRALEVKGETNHKGWTDSQNLANINKYIDGMTKAIVAFNGQIGAKDFHSAFKFSRGASNSWSEQFATEVLPSIMNELKKSSKGDASQAGNALQSMYSTVVDNVMTPARMANWDRFGMFGPGALKKGKGGKMTVNPGQHMLGYDQFMNDPYAFVQKVLLPHMQEHGIDVGNRDKVVAEMGGLFGNRVAKQIATILATQQAMIEKDAENVRKAMGVNGLGMLMGMDPNARMQVVAASFKDLGASIADIAEPAAMRGMKGVIDWAKGTTDWVRNSPDMHRWGQHFEAATAGFFKQDPLADVHSRHWMARGADKQFYDLGKQIRDFLGDLKGGIKKQFADLGISDAADSMKALVADVKAVRETFKAFDDANSALERFSDQLDASVVDGLKASLQGLKDAFSSTAAWFESKFGWMFGDGRKANGVAPASNAQAAATLLPGAGGIGLHRAYADKLVPTMSSFDPTKGIAFGPSGFKSPLSNALTPIAQATNSTTPFMAAGERAMSALAGGLTAGSAKASGEMSALMGNLAAIASRGIDVDVNLRTAGAEAQLSAFMAKANGASKGTGRPQFSPALNDLGQ